MDAHAGRDALIDEEHAAFIQGAVSMLVAARDAQLVAVNARAFGCRVAQDRRRVTLLLCRPQAQRVLECLQANGAIAAVFSQPSTHRTLQLKGRDAIVDAVLPADQGLMARYVEGIVAEFGPLGFSAPFARTLMACPSEQAVAVSFTPAAAFMQTPGPRAGEPLRR